MYKKNKNQYVIMPPACPLPDLDAFRNNAKKALMRLSKWGSIAFPIRNILSFKVLLMLFERRYFSSRSLILIVSQNYNIL